MALNPDMGQDSNTEMDPRIVDQMCRAARDAAEKVMRRRIKNPLHETDYMVTAAALLFGETFEYASPENITRRINALLEFNNVPYRLRSLG